MRTVAQFLAVFFLYSSSLVEQDYKTLLDLPSGVTLLKVSATVREEVTQDLLVATLRYEIRNRDARELQNEINAKMRDALAKAQSFLEIRAVTQQYSIYQTQVPPNRSDMIWVGSQGLELRSKQADELLKLTGELQSLGFSMQNLSYVVSPELYEATHDSLMEKALLKLQERASRAARALGKREADLAEVDVRTNQADVQSPMMHNRAFAMEMAADSSMSAPVAEAGESHISLTVSASALLKP